MRLARRGALLAALVLSLTLPRSVRAQTAIEEASRPLIRPPVWELAAGVRTMFIKDPGYDAFSTDDGLVQFTLSGTRAVVRDNRLALVAGLGLDIGGSSATARGAPSSLTLTRLAMLVEGRYQPATRLYLFGRLAPGFLHGTATIEDASSPSASGLGATFDTFSLDASAGGAFCFGDMGNANVHVGAWLVADGGYGWAASEHLVLAPSLGADQSKAGTLDLGSLAPRGGFFRIALALSY